MLAWAKRVLKNAVLSGADLRGFDLSEFQFTGKANLEKADLAVAKLVGADLWGANFKDAIGLTAYQLSRATNFAKALNIPADVRKEVGI